MPPLWPANALPSKAPKRLWVVEMGRPRRVAVKTVNPAPRTTAAMNSGAAISWSGTSPLPVKTVMSSLARKAADRDPRNVVTVAQARAVR